MIQVTLWPLIKKQKAMATWRKIVSWEKQVHSICKYVQIQSDLMQSCSFTWTDFETTKANKNLILIYGKRVKFSYIVFLLISLLILSSYSINHTLVFWFGLSQGKLIQYKTYALSESFSSSGNHLIRLLIFSNF